MARLRDGCRAPREALDLGNLVRTTDVPVGVFREGLERRVISSALWCAKEDIARIAAVSSSAGVPTAIVQVDLDAVPRVVRVDARYTGAFVIIRRHGRPVARFTAPAVEGIVDPGAVSAALADAVQRHARSWRYRDYIGAAPGPPLLPATVAICTRERPDDLRRTLTAVANLAPPPAEIIVIDNDPVSPRTRDVVAEFAGVRYICEPRRGLDRARNSALRHARTPIVAFTDDDAAPEREWLGALLPAFADERVWCATGLTLPFELETEAQEWFERYSPFGRGFRQRIIDGQVDDSLSVAAAGAGASMAIRVAVLDELGGFDEALDAGTPTRSGGDHDMFGRILMAGQRIVYEPAAVSWHRHRRSWDDLRQALHGYGVGVSAVWTRRLVRDRDARVIGRAIRWLRRHHLPLLWRAARGMPGAVPAGLVWAEFSGCFRGPVAYRRSLREARDAPPS